MTSLHFFSVVMTDDDPLVSVFMIIMIVMKNENAALFLLFPLVMMVMTVRVITSDG